MYTLKKNSFWNIEPCNKYMLTRNLPDKLVQTLNKGSSVVRKLYFRVDYDNDNSS